MSSKRPALLIFSKSADLGKVKTRMRGLLSDEEGLAFHLALLRDTLLQTAAVPAERYLYLAGSGHLPFDPAIAVRMQNGSNLGARLHHAFAETLREHDRVIAIGSDSPMINATAISAAFQELNDHDVVLGPAEDGGYYLIGMKFLIPAIFQEISWGTSQVFSETISALGEFRVKHLPLGFDVDTPEDLERLRREIKLAGETTPAPHTAEWLRNHSAT